MATTTTRASERVHDERGHDDHGYDAHGDNERGHSERGLDDRGHEELFVWDADGWDGAVCPGILLLRGWRDMLGRDPLELPGCLLRPLGRFRLLSTILSSSFNCAAYRTTIFSRSSHLRSVTTANDPSSRRISSRKVICVGERP